MKIVIYMIIALLLISIALAQEVQVIKESPQEIKLNEIIEIKIHISNPSSAESEFSIEEILPRDVEVIEPATTFTRRNDALDVKYYSWTTTVSPNSIKTITYRIKPLSLGEYSIGSTQVTYQSEIFESNSITFNVKCTPNNQCEENENSLTCPEDCSTGISDGICNYKADGVCDPDCDEEPDCRKSEFNMNYIIIPFIILILIVLALWLLPKIFKKKEKFQVQEETPAIKYTEQPPKDIKGESQETDPLADMENNQ